MKKFNYKLIIPGALVLLIATNSCKSFLDKTPSGSLNTVNLANKAGVDGLLIGAYSLLDGVYEGGPSDPWTSGTNNWVFGGVGADDAHKGSTPGDQPGAAQIEAHTATSVNGYLNPKWLVMFNGVQRANDVIRELPLVKDGSVSADYAKEVTAEARFLRGFYQMELAKLWRNVPYADETVTYENGNYDIGNPGPIWDKIEADFKAAADNLPDKQDQIGRANKWAAKSFLAKAYMFDHKYTEALAILNDVISNGMTSAGAKYDLVRYADNFNPSTKNGAEGVFVIQTSVHDNSNGYNGNGGDVLNFPSGGPATCCGFYQPSFSFVNAFKVDANGLPIFDHYNDEDLPNDQGVPASSAWDATKKYNGPTATGDPVTLAGHTFPHGLGDAVSRPTSAAPNTDVVYVAVTTNTGVDPLTDNGSNWIKVWTEPSTVAVDSRLDWSVGRRGIPYLDWGIHPGQAWARDQADGGPYSPIKNAYYKAQQASTSDSYGGWAANQSTANSYNAIRFADVLLWAAECEIEVGSLTRAEALVNRVRARAAATSNFVKDDNGQPAANYKVGQYNGQFTLNGKAYARTAVQFERRLELGMEGHRFFDLQRWDGRFGGPMPTGFMAGVLNAYLAHENAVPNFPIALIKGAKFTSGVNEVYPIPQGQIDVTHGNIKQNPGY